MSFQRKPKQSAATGGHASPGSSRSPKLTRMSVPSSGGGSRSTQSAVAPGQLAADGSDSAPGRNNKTAACGGGGGGGGGLHVHGRGNCSSMSAGGGDVAKEGITIKKNNLKESYQSISQFKNPKDSCFVS